MKLGFLDVHYSNNHKVHINLSKIIKIDETDEVFIIHLPEDKQLVFKFYDDIEAIQTIKKHIYPA